MKKFVVPFVLFFSLVCFSQTKIKPSEAKNNIGNKVTVTGIVTQVHMTKSGTYFLNFGKYPNQEFAAVIFKSYVTKMNDINKYQGKNVEITGTVKNYKGKPEIIINSPDQIKIIE